MELFNLAVQTPSPMLNTYVLFGVLTCVTVRLRLRATIFLKHLSLCDSMYTCAILIECYCYSVSTVTVVLMRKTLI